MTTDERTAVILVAHGTEEVEGITPGDVLARCGVKVTYAGVGGVALKGANGVPLGADTTVEELASAGSLFDAIVVPGGDAGARAIAANDAAGTLIRHHFESDRLVASICASPAVVLAPLGVLNGRKATCYPGYEEALSGEITFSEDRVVEAGNVITSRGPGTAMEFALSVGARLAGAEQAAAVREGMLVA